MQHTETKYPVNKDYVALCMGAVIFSWLVHEGAHWAAGQLLGYDMVMTLNKGYPKNGMYNHPAHYQLISAAGPAITLMQAAFIFLYMRQRAALLLYPFLFTCFYMRFLATGLRISNPNDEARISSWLGLGTFTLPLIVVAFLLFMLYRISRQYRFNGKLQLHTALPVVLTSSAIILVDQFFFLRIL